MSSLRSPSCSEARRLARLVCAGVASLLLAAGSAVSSDPAVAVIVHPDRKVELTVDELARIYLRKRRFWDDGEPIIPLNRNSGSATRQIFSHRVLRRSNAALTRYWNERYFEGVFPPFTLSSDAAVKRYVASNRNAIGYIDASLLDHSVSVVLRLE